MSSLMNTRICGSQPALLVDHPEADPGKQPIKIGKDIADGCTVGLHVGCPSV